MNINDIKAVAQRSSDARSCEGCAKCCEGWLSGEAYGHAFYKGRPCFFLNKICTIYDVRPDKPCKSYKCGWLAEDIFPHWMKPSLSNAIITKREFENIVYYEIIEAGGSLDAKVLSWLVHWSLNTNNNILYQIDKGTNKIGSQEFLRAPI